MFFDLPVLKVGGAGDGASAVGRAVRIGAGSPEGEVSGFLVDCAVGSTVGFSAGCAVRRGAGRPEGKEVGFLVGCAVGSVVAFSNDSREGWV